MRVDRQSPRKMKTTSETRTKRLSQRVDDLLDRRVEELRYVVVDLVVHPRRERALLELLHLRLDVRDDLRRVAAVGLLEDDGGGRMVVEVRIDIEELASELHLRDVFQAEDLTLRVRANDDVLVLIGLVVTALVREHVLERLRFFAGCLTEPTRRADDALLADRLHHLVRGDVVGAHLVRVEPDTHRVLP